MLMVQVNYCEDQLRQLEISSQQLLQASDEQVSSAAVASDAFQLGAHQAG